MQRLESLSRGQMKSIDITIFAKIMKEEIRHRRLYAFYHSKVLNALMIVIIVGIFLMGYYKSYLLPVICSATGFLLFIGYTAWLWIKKPQKIMINNWLSDISGSFTLYFLIVTALKAENQWWYIFPIVCAVLILFLCMINPKGDKTFIITP